VLEPNSHALVLEETHLPRRLERAGGLCLAAMRLASVPAGSLICRFAFGSLPCGVNRGKSALCGIFRSDLRYVVGDLRTRRVKMLSRHSTAAATSIGGADVMAVAISTPRDPSVRKTPHPTRERGAGQHTDLAFPNAPEDDERGGGA
jgi:hypothetical protein